MRTSFGVGVIGLLVLAMPSVAAAQPRDAAAAETLYRTAKEAAKKGDWATACAQFAESQKFDPGPGTLLNLADCEEHRGQLARAWQHFVQAETDLPKGDSRVAFAHDRAAALDKRVPRLVVKLAAGVPASTVVVKDEQVLGAASLGVALPVDGGEHVVATSAPGFQTARQTVTIANGETRELVVAPGERMAGDATPAAVSPGAAGTVTETRETPHAAREGHGTLGWIFVGAGAVGIVTGSITGLMAFSRASTVKDTCGPEYLTCNSSSVDAAGGGSTLATVSTIGFVAGAALAGVGVYFLVTQPSAPARAALRVGPSGAALVGSF